MTTRTALQFDCHGDRLIGIVDLPEEPGGRGVLLVVGGPQYRVGSHRQFALLARGLAERGVPAMRFDHRGIGDSEGQQAGFDRLDDDIRAAIDEFCRQAPAIEQIVIWGLCDAASAAMIYAAQDDRVAGIVALNPWVRSEQTLARSYLRGYYVAQLFNVRFWRRLLTGKVGVRAALAGFLGNLGAALRRGAGGHDSTRKTEPFQVRMKRGLDAFDGRTLLILSGDDVTAAEFRTLTESSRDWGRVLESDRVDRRFLQAANHTFSRREWRDQVLDWTSAWLQSW